MAGSSKGTSDTEIAVKRYRYAALVVAVAVGILGACSTGSDKGTLIQVEVGEHFSSASDGLYPGDPLAGAVVRLYRGDTVVLETVLDSEGSATVAPEPGTYDVNVSLDSAAPGGYCSWGNTVQSVVFPHPTLLMEARFACAGAPRER